MKNAGKSTKNIEKGGFKENRDESKNGCLYFGISS